MFARVGSECPKNKGKPVVPGVIPINTDPKKEGRWVPLERGSGGEALCGSMEGGHTLWVASSLSLLPPGL